MKISEKLFLIKEIVKLKKFVTARDIFLTMCILYPESSESFVSPNEVGQLINQVPEIKSIQEYDTSPKKYYFSK